MSPIILAGPAVEPVTLPDMKVYLRLDGSDEDELVAALIAAARITIERATRLALTEQLWRLRLDAWPAGRIVALPLAPFLAVEEVRIFDEDGAAFVVDPQAYRADGAADDARLVIEAAAPVPGRASGGIEIDLKFGFGPDPDTVPEPLRLATRRLVAHWFEHRGDEAPRAPAGLPAEVRTLMAPFVRPRLA